MEENNQDWAEQEGRNNSQHGWGWVDRLENGLGEEESHGGHFPEGLVGQGVWGPLQVEAGA